MRTLKNSNRADITYELVSDEGKLANDDKEKLFKLLKKIEKGKSVSKKFKKPGYSPRKILLTKVVYSHEGRKDIFTLLRYAEFCKNNQAVKDLLEEAKKHGLLDEVDNEKIISEYLGSYGKPIRTYSVVKDGVVKVKVLQDVGITADSRIITTDDENSKKVLSLSMINQGTAIVGRLIGIKSCESDAEGIQDTAVSTEQEPNASDSLLSKLCFDSDTADKEEKPLTKAKQQRKVITIDPKLEEKLIGDLVWEEECKESLNTSAIEHATEFVPSIGDSEAADNELIYEKSATASTETVAQGLNASDSLSSSKPYFYSKFGKENTADEKEKLPMQQRQAIVVASAGVVLLVSSIALYIMKMPVVVAVVGIAGLACIGFALYNAIKPGTKLEKVEDIEQPIVESSLNPI